MAGSKKNVTSDLIKQEDVVQAVVIADSFNIRFAPLTDSKPRVLLPLVNTTLLEYTLCFLSTAGVKETFLFCCAHAQQIREYVQTSRWSSPESSMTVTTIASESYLSLGDVIRELDVKGFIRGDFILISGDVVASLPILDILENHKKQRTIDKGLVMTMVVRKALPGHRTRCLEDEAVVIANSSTNKLLHFQKSAKQQKITCPLSVFQENSEVMIRYDLLDTHISICSPQVPLLFTDNFDFQTRDDFVRGVLVNEEILGNSIHIHVAEDGYAARVSNLFMYDAVSRDIIERWAFPIALDIQNCAKQRYTYHRHNVYKHQDVDLARNCILDKNVVIGKGTKIGTNTRIVNSVIGRNCCIGDGVHIEGAYIWDNVKIGNHCRLQTCLLAENVILKSHVVVSPGCVLSYKVLVGPKVTLKDNTHLQAESPADEFGDSEVLKPDLNIVGQEGHGYICHSTHESDEELDEEVRDVWGIPIQSEDEEFSSPEVSSDEGSLADSPVPDDPKMFYNEVLDSLQRGVDEKIKCDNLILEINSSKYAYNVTMRELNTLVMKAILEIPAQKFQKVPQPQEYLNQLKSPLIYLLPLLRNYIKSEESQIDCLMSLEEYCITHSYFESVLIKVLHLLYEKDVLAEDIILKWYKNPPAMIDHDLAEQERVRKQIVPFITWLEEAEETSEED